MSDNMMQQEMLESIEPFQYSYQEQNLELLKLCDATWFKMHIERQQMMLKKEDYCNSMFELEQL